MSYPASIIKAFNDGDYSDLVITCGNLRLDVHKLVLCTGSKFFRNACRFGVGKEAEDQCIDLPTDDPEMVRRMIVFFYTGDYEPTSICDVESLRSINHSRSSDDPAPVSSRLSSPTAYLLGLSIHSNSTSSAKHNYACSCVANVTEMVVDQPTASRPPNTPDAAILPSRKEDTYQIKNPLTVHASMYALADKYLSEPLASCAHAKFKSCLNDHWDSVDFIEAVQIVYSSTLDSNRGLRDVVRQTFRDYFHVDLGGLPGAEEELAHIDKLSFLLMKSWPKKGK
ncbi:hypothetical protein K505DRAFT_366350 [Melanomma pulvis-pyrius CBS 109.77]|uniref:BTB domain-containing protein n=1 Tax=Melanomma pulvis-pyrius CBS 109.77 TaxID=1314802 RepID=A0A6A6WWW2_9PLEO|nr:hypothetical protein K505DRAFT_366350 [Melanomma pulvis-pyrius CBS 109.77]